MSQLFFKEKPLIGLDISQSSAKFIGLSPKSGNVSSYGYIELDQARMQNVQEIEAHLKTQLNEMLNKHSIGRLPSRHVAVSVPTYRTFTRSISLPRAAEDDLLSAIHLEAEQYIPVSINELYIDHEVIEKRDDTIEALMSAVPKLYVDATMSACTSIGLTPVLVEPGIMAVARLIRRAEGGELPTVILDVGADSTDIAILDKSIRVTGSVDVGGHTMTQAIMKAAKVTREAAHVLRTQSGLNLGPKQTLIRKSLEPSLDRIISETKKVMRYYTERLGSKNKIEQLIIVGGGSNMPGLGDYFTENMVIASRVASPWQILDFGKLKPIPKQLQPRFITAIGLGMVDHREVWQ
ncbi:type IV pilus assembly protein PilM [Candidatus Saccharibacteria bacterium]|nr:type IV pilus assembly protein PilM [Candidatus Saccharibacteria bacterium]